MMRKLLLLLPALIAASIVLGQTKPSNNEIWYVTSDGNLLTLATDPAFNASISSHTYADGKGIIVFDANVTSIEDYAFNKCTTLTSITFPDSLLSIGLSAFSGCKALKHTLFSDNSKLQNIGTNAFGSCVLLDSVSLPKSVVTIGNSAYSGCTGLTTMAFADNAQLETIGQYSFGGCNQLASIDVPESVTTIKTTAFSGCSLLEAVYFHSTDPSGYAADAFKNNHANLMLHVPATAYETYLAQFPALTITVDMNEYRPLALAKIDDALATLNTLSADDNVTINGYKAVINETNDFTVAVGACNDAIAIINNQKALETALSGAIGTMSTRQEGPTVEIVGNDGVTIKLYNVKSVKYGQEH